MNNIIRNMQSKLLSENWGILKKLTFDYKKNEDTWETQVREVYDRGNGATILLYNTSKKTVILTRQFRIPTYLNGNSDGLMIEACAGKLDEENPDDCIVREVEEETGIKITSAERVFEAYMSPGSVTEKIYFYVAPYEDHMRTGKGGGLESEQENIEVLEVYFKDALKMIAKGEIQDAKTIMLMQHLALQGSLT